MKNKKLPPEYTASEGRALANPIWRLFLLGISFAALLSISFIPITLVAHPFLQDYPNHLARIYIHLTKGAYPLDQYYKSNWGLLPNLAFDIIVLAFAKLMPLAAAGKVYIFATFLLLI